MKNTYVAVYSGDKMMCAFKFENSEKVSNHFFDVMTDNGYIIKSLTEEEYNLCTLGDELSIDDIKNGNYRVE